MEVGLIRVLSVCYVTGLDANKNEQEDNTGRQDRILAAGPRGKRGREKGFFAEASSLI